MSSVALVRRDPPHEIYHWRRRPWRPNDAPAKWGPGRLIAFNYVLDAIRAGRMFWLAPRYRTRTVDPRPVHAGFVSSMPFWSVWMRIASNELRLAAVRPEYIAWLREEILRDDVTPVRARWLRAELIGGEDVDDV